MEQNEMVALLRNPSLPTGGVWADLGAGTGNFTWALAELLGPDATIHAIDRDAKAIVAMRTRQLLTPPAARIIPIQADVTQRLALPPLHGVLMANLLHFIREQARILRQLSSHLQPGGQLLIVEYEQQHPISYVPYPVPFARFASLAAELGLTDVRQVGSRTSPSSGRILYAASAILPAPADALL
mgnify:CR=1 FL=1